MSEQQWRSVLRQLIALGHLRAEGEFNTLALTDSSREVLRGEVQLLLRVPARRAARAASARKAGRAAKDKAPPLPLDAPALQRFDALKAWRAEVAREHNLPAFVVFHDATLAQMARERPADAGRAGRHQRRRREEARGLRRGDPARAAAARTSCSQALQRLAVGAGRSLSR